MSINYKELSKGQVVNHLRTRFIDDGVAIIDNFLEKDVSKKINNLWMKEAKFYWWDLIDTLGKDRDEEVPIGLVPGGRTKMVAPIEKWECNYCQYKLICKGS